MSRLGYKHSESFASLKGIQEKIGVNLTTGQYLQGLDALIMKALSPIVYSTNWFDVFLPKMLSWKTNNPRRKIVTDNLLNMPEHMLSFMLTNDPTEKLEIIKKCRFDRYILIEGIARFLSATDHYVQCVECTAEVPDRYKDDPLAYFSKEKFREEQTFGVTPGRSLRVVIQQAEFFLTETIEFRNKILEKFNRLCLVEAQKTYVRLNYEIELDDIIQVYRLCAQRALDKCDSGQGVLATHILNWLKTGANSIAKQRSAQPSEDDDVESLSEDVAIEENHIELRDSVDHVRALAKLADPNGAARVYLGLEEVLSHKSRAILYSFRVEAAASNQV